jgi:anaerobic selenocysteine-containing dehydrogenase
MVQESPSLVGLPEPVTVRLSPADAADLGLEPGSLVAIDREEATFELPFEIDPGLVPGTVWLPFRLPGFDVRELLAAGRPVTGISIRSTGGA